MLSVSSSEPESVPHLHWSNVHDEHQEPAGVPGLALLPVHAHHLHLRAGAVGEVPLQPGSFLRRRHGDLHRIRVRAPAHATGAGVLLRRHRRSTSKHHGVNELGRGLRWASLVS